MTSIRRRWPWRPVFAALGLATLLLWLFMYSRGRNLRAVPVKLEERPKVILRQGRYIGLNLGKDYPRTIEAFFGLPYGLSTAGLGRFRAPVRVDASELEFDASHYGDGCPSGGGGEKRQSENCLNLNLYRQKTRNSGDNLPVLVHFHGGAFNFGPGVASWDVSHLTAWSAEPMIAISFNYRVGALGFLPSKLMAEEGLLNAGLKDQELLLEWVQENIAAFGGDPDNVTIMGSSAGAHSVSVPGYCLDMVLLSHILNILCLIRYHLESPLTPSGRSPPLPQPGPPAAFRAGNHRVRRRNRTRSLHAQ